MEFPARFKVAAAWGQLLRVVNSVVDELGAKDVANACDRAPSSFDAALSERERHSLKARDLVTVLLMDKRRTLLRYLADLVDCDLVERQPLTDEERRSATLAELARMAPDLVKIAEERAMGGRR